MLNAPDQILSLSQLVEAGYVPHFRPSAQKSWLTTPCKKRITVVLVDGVWRMPLWQDSVHPWVLHSDTAITGALRLQRTIGASDKRVSWHTASLPLSEPSNSEELTSARHRRQTSFLAHTERGPVTCSQFGGALVCSLSQFGGALTQHAIRGDCGYSAALTTTDSDNFVRMYLSPMVRYQGVEEAGDTRTHRCGVRAMIRFDRSHQKIVSS